jgi:hypothetical protein
MVPSNADTVIQASTPPPAATDVSALKDKDVLSRAEGIVMAVESTPSFAPQTGTAEESKAHAQPTTTPDQIGEASSELSTPPPPASPVSEAAPLHSDDNRPLPKATTGGAMVKPHKTPEPEHEQRPNQRFKKASSSKPTDLEVEMNDSLPTPSPTDLDSRMQPDDKYRRLKRKLKEVLEVCSLSLSLLTIDKNIDNKQGRSLRPYILPCLDI